MSVPLSGVDRRRPPLRLAGLGCQEFSAVVGQQKPRVGWRRRGCGELARGSSGDRRTGRREPLPEGRSRGRRACTAAPASSGPRSARSATSRNGDGTPPTALPNRSTAASATVSSTARRDARRPRWREIVFGPTEQLAQRGADKRRHRKARAVRRRSRRSWPHGVRRRFRRAGTGLAAASLSSRRTDALPGLTNASARNPSTSLCGWTSMTGTPMAGIAAYSKRGSPSLRWPVASSSPHGRRERIRVDSRVRRWCGCGRRTLRRKWRCRRRFGSSHPDRRDGSAGGPPGFARPPCLTMAPIARQQAPGEIVGGDVDVGVAAWVVAAQRGRATTRGC